MARIIICPICGESENLSGSQTAQGIEIRCGECDGRWMRDEQPERCASCGGTELVKHTRALTQYSRGTQLSIVGVGEILLCRECDAKMVEWCEGNRAAPPSYQSAAEKVDDRADEHGSDSVLMTP